jgi:four helix bundle protein
MTELKEPYDLEKRTLKFSGEVILLIKEIPKDIINNPLISQLVRSATSIGANYCEANGACSGKDFKNKIYICKKECKETKYWLELLGKSNVSQIEMCRKLWKEAQELTLIFSKIIITLEKKGKSEK